MRFKIKIKRLIKEMVNKFYIDCSNGLEDLVFLTSQGRSGSTLVSRLITSGGSFRNHHEPFHKEFVEEAKLLYYGRYIDKKANLPVERVFVDNIFKGKIYNHWIGMGTFSFYFRNRLVKAIRTNLYTGWIKENFPEIKVVILIRNPFAVAESWINVNFANPYQYRALFVKQESLMIKLPHDVKELFKSQLSLKEQLIFNWCLEYFILFKDLNPRDYKLLVFERLLEDSEKEMKELLNFIDVPYHDNWKGVLIKPSMTTSKNSSARVEPGKLHEKWRTTWTENEIARGRRIMTLFGFQDVYANSFPNKAQFTSLYNK